MAEVKIYTTSTCPWCVKAKEWMTEHNIKFKEINVSKDQKAAQYMVEKTGQRGVPVIEIDGKFIVGFDEEELTAALL